MPHYEVDFSYKVEEFGIVDMDADDIEQAEAYAREHIAEAYPEVIDVQIDAIRELKR